MSKLKPNFTQIPNILFDDWLPKLEKGELKVLLYIMRRTFGFHKNKDKISFSQLQDGITKLDNGTGLGRETLSRSISLLEKKNILIVNREKSINSYELNTEYTCSTIIELVPQSNQTSTIIEPELVPQSNLQNKEKESIQNKDNAWHKTKHKITNEENDPVKISEVIKEFEYINPACKRMYGNKTQRQAVSDLIDTYTFERVISVVKFLPKSNNVCFWKATTPKQLWDNWVNIKNDIISKFNKEAMKNNNIAF